MKIAILCSSSEKISKEDRDKSKEIFEVIASQFNYDLVIGGNSNSSLLDCFSIFKKYHKKVTCITTENRKKENNNSEIIITSNSTTRTEMICNQADILLIMPGGIGTLREYATILDMKRELEMRKEIILYNQDEFFKNILTWIEKGVHRGYIDKTIFNMYQVVSSKKELENILNNKKIGENL